MIQINLTPVPYLFLSCTCTASLCQAFTINFFFYKKLTIKKMDCNKCLKFRKFVNVFLVQLCYCDIRKMQRTFSAHIFRDGAVGVMVPVLISACLVGKVNGCDRWLYLRGVLFPVARVWVSLHIVLTLLMKADTTVNRSVMNQWLSHSGNDTNQSMSQLPMDNTAHERQVECLGLPLFKIAQIWNCLFVFVVFQNV